MTNFIRRLVSKNKRRLQEGNFDLDLSYVGDKIIAMGYPASGFESLYRNDFDSVKQFLDTHHGDKYFVYNLCSERSYEPCIFDNRVERYPFDDHNPPKFDQIRQCCISCENWLSRDPENIVVIHCKAGKGRTGVMICALIMKMGMRATAREALQLYGQTRTFDEKGVTIPSQRHYVYYYELFLHSGLSHDLEFVPQPCQITRVRATGVPSKWFTRSLRIKVETMDGTYSDTFNVIPEKIHKGEILEFNLEGAIPELTGDFKLSAILKKKTAWYMWLNSNFVTPEESYKKADIDKASKGKKFSSKFEFSIFSVPREQGPRADAQRAPVPPPPPPAEPLAMQNINFL